LQRRQLVGYWDLTVFLDARNEVTGRRKAERYGVDPYLNEEDLLRWYEGKSIYLQAWDPIAKRRF
jgi:diketogulonate reductase-like aldo/keto reductase